MARRRHAQDGIRAARVYKVAPPSSGDWWAGLRRDQRWCCAWRTPVMKASAFWYFRSERGAETFAASIVCYGKANP